MSLGITSATAEAPAKYELHSIIRFLQAEGNSAAEIHRRMSRIYAENCISDGVEQQFKWDAYERPTYSPDLIASDFHLFFELKNWLGGQSFPEKKELQSNFKAHLTSLAATIFEESIGNLVYRYDKCLNLHGDYVEK
ncbi:hypothetical protein AVEN_102214-1 [Araneus ventricosus]|uniref:Histone-lysine N-methyltransferase SETMAR n=1 Tax=Araneus ventricosus TaxID=182803 RepID=A0A4Y2U6H9_ARAVE|nr:hypothetical protein AVEN_247024-1 [Araneus ventricosus]GBO07197.1 hypothetical protein AVEN_102214-1 [Araneus ventricosus]